MEGRYVWMMYSMDPMRHRAVLLSILHYLWYVGNKRNDGDTVEVNSFSEDDYNHFGFVIGCYYGGGME